jgi:hypothetical protein
MEVKNCRGTGGRGARGVRLGGRSRNFEDETEDEDEDAEQGLRL